MGKDDWYGVRKIWSHGMWRNGSASRIHKIIMELGDRMKWAWTRMDVAGKYNVKKWLSSYMPYAQQIPSLLTRRTEMLYAYR
jgi:hypothetical protein